MQELHDDNFFVCLDTMDLLQVNGDDNEKFLQGQLTCDLGKLASEGSSSGAACNNKGRMYSAFKLFRIEQNFYLEMFPGLGEITTAQLKRYIPFYKAGIAPATEFFPKRIMLSASVLTAVLKDAGISKPADGEGVKLPEAYVFNTGISNLLEVWQSPEQLQLFPGFITGITTGLIETDLQQLKMLYALSGYYPFEADDVEKFTPQELNYDQKGFVDFDKGCYTGQEIVARMHYRGKAKNGLFPISLYTPDDLPAKTSSTELLPSSFAGESIIFQEQSVGTVLKLVGSRSGNLTGMAIIKLDIAQEQPTSLQNSTLALKNSQFQVAIIPELQRN